ncbi:MAG: peptide deformylase [Rickettsiaceae bacterium]|nr:peptide deformylase [Rickettsiaceae bacterium]
MKGILDKDDPILRQIAEPVAKDEFDRAWLKDLINDLFTIMADKGAVGVAAPQIGISKRVIVFGTAYSKRRSIEHQIPSTALINPSFIVLSDEKQIGYEGCLNCGDLMGDVSRAMEIEYSGFDADGNLVTKRASGLEARILQHEIDHLNGHLFLDYLASSPT